MKHQWWHLFIRGRKTREEVEPGIPGTKTVTRCAFCGQVLRIQR